MLFVGTAARAEVVDRVVAAVDEELITASQVQFEAELASLDASPSPFWDVRRTDALSRLIEAAKARRLAGDVPLYQPAESEVHARIDGIRQHFGRAQWEAFLERFGLDEKALIAIMRRRIVVERYLDRHITIDARDARAWWEACHKLLDGPENPARIYVIPPMGP